MSSEYLPSKFARSLIHHGLGYALYEPISESLIYPGACGYLNDVGTWNPVCDLGDNASLKKLGLSPCAELQKAPDSEREWGPKLSDNITAKELKLEGKVSLIPAGIPASIGALFTFESSSENAAILLTQSPVVKKSVYHEHPFKTWVKENARALAIASPDAVEHDLYIVTSTHATDVACMNCISSKGHKVSVGFDAGFTPLGEVAPSASWHTSSSDSGWVKVTAENAQDHKVVFFGGIRFHWRFGGLTKSHVETVKQKDWAFRGPGENDSIAIPKDNDHDNDLELNVEAIGDAEHRLGDEKEILEEDSDDDF